MYNKRLVEEHFILHYGCHPDLAKKIAEDAIAKAKAWQTFIATKREVHLFITMYSHLRYESLVYDRVDVSKYRPIQQSQDPEIPDNP